jgi:hypothetical protein
MKSKVSSTKYTLYNAPLHKASDIKIVWHYIESRAYYKY